MFGPFSSLLTAARRAGRGALRLRVRRGRGRRSVGVRRRVCTTSSTSRSRSRTTSSRSRSGSPRCRPSQRPEDGRLRDGQRPVHAAAAAGRAEDPPERGRQDRAQQGVPRGGHRLHGDRRPGRLDRRAGGAPRLGRRADRVGVRPHLHPAALQPEGVHRHRRPRPGRAVRQGGRPRQRERDLRPQRLVRRLQEGRQPRRWSRSTSPSTAARRPTSTPTSPRRTRSVRCSPRRSRRPHGFDQQKILSYLHSGATLNSVQGPVKFDSLGENLAQKTLDLPVAERQARADDPDRDAAVDAADIPEARWAGCDAAVRRQRPRRRARH